MRARRLECPSGDRGRLEGRGDESVPGFQKEEGEGWATPGGGGTEEKGKGRVAQREGIESRHGVNSREKERDQGKGKGAGPLVTPAGGPEEGGVFQDNGGEQKESARDTGRGCAGGEAREGWESKRAWTRAQAGALSRNLIRCIP